MARHRAGIDSTTAECARDSSKSGKNNNGAQDRTRLIAIPLQASTGSLCGYYDRSPINRGANFKAERNCLSISKIQDVSCSSPWSR